jgi:hypothetical protein
MSPAGSGLIQMTEMTEVSKKRNQPTTTLSVGLMTKQSSLMEPLRLKTSTILQERRLVETIARR